MRPADQLFPDRPKALAEGRCIAKPIGCGEPVKGFDDALSEREYKISALCQACQDKIFTHEEE